MMVITLADTLLKRTIEKQVFSKDKIFVNFEKTQIMFLFNNKIKADLEVRRGGRKRQPKRKRERYFYL